MGCVNSKIDPTTLIKQNGSNHVSDNRRSRKYSGQNSNENKNNGQTLSNVNNHKISETHVNQTESLTPLHESDEHKSNITGLNLCHNESNDNPNFKNEHQFSGYLTSYERVQEIVGKLAPGELYCDPDFQANYRALTISHSSEPLAINWMRPKDIVPDGKNPHMLVDGISSDDIKQGLLGDCWFLSSCAAVSQQEYIMTKIIPEDQPLCGPDYKGLVHFRFWRFGQWVDVYTDDLLPVVDGKLIFARGDDPTEFWVPLVEKAYAKLHGSYEALEGGQTMDALVDLTGGLAERYSLRGADPNMYRTLINAHKSGSFIACSRKGDWRNAKPEDNGLVSGHAYTVTNVMRINHHFGEEKLLQIRNPWGDGTEWKGSWSDHDTNWEWVDEETKSRMKLAQRDDGEFWMCYKDFCRQFQELVICSIDSQSQTGHMETIKGHWVKGDSAGGSRNDLEKFATNPQYLLTLTEPDTFDPQTDDPEIEGKVSVVVALMQQQVCIDSNMAAKKLQINFVIYQADKTKRRLDQKHFRFIDEWGKSGTHINLREVSGRFELEPGHYIIIPSTFIPDQSAHFMLRIFAQKQFTVQGPL